MFRRHSARRGFRVCARELLNLVSERTIIKRKHKKVLSKTSPCCLPRAEGSWSLLARRVSKGMEQNKDMQSWSLSKEKGTLLFFIKPTRKGLSPSPVLQWEAELVHSFGGHFTMDATSAFISPGTSSVLLKNFPRMQGSKQG